MNSYYPSFSGKAIELGGGNNPIFHPNIDTRKLPNVDIVIDFNNPPYTELNSNEYDLVYSSYLIEHISWRNVKKFINEIYRILRPGGKAYIVTANLYEQCKVIANSNKWDENFSTMIFGDLDYPENSHKFGLSPDYAVQLFKKIGFKKVDIIPHPNCKTDMIIEATKTMTIETVIQKDNYDSYNRAYYDGDSKQGYHPPGYNNFPSNYTIANEILSQLKQLNIENKCVDTNISNVLELGGGRGYISHILEGRGIAATCIDVSKHCFYTRACKNFILADATEKLPFEDKQFDLAFSKDFLEHIFEEKIDNLVKEIVRVSKRGFHLVTFSDHPHSRDDSTHQCLKSKDWWIEKFKSVPDYNCIIEDKEIYEHADLDIIKSFHSPSNISRINVGSFTQMYREWENWDIINLKDWASINGFCFNQVDITKQLPKEDNSIELINCSHTIEHLTREEGLSFLTECYRILKPNGVLRIAIPDTRTICKTYIEKRIADYKEFNIGVEKSKDDAQALYHMLIEGHKTLYDFESLNLILEMVGFSEITQMKFLESKSRIIEKEVIDQYPEISIYVEAIKDNESGIKSAKYNDTNKNWDILTAGNVNKDLINNSTEATKPINNSTEATKPINNSTETTKPINNSTETTKPINDTKNINPANNTETTKSTNTKSNIEFKLSIVYITYRPGGYDLLLSSLLQQRYKNYELIVIDDYPGRSEIIKSIFEFHKIPLKYLGPSKQKCYPDNLYGATNAINTGAMCSSGDIIILLQDYTYLPSDALENWNVAFNNTGLNTIITGTATIYTSPVPNNWHGLFSTWDKPINENIAKLPGFNRKEDWIPEKYEGFYTGIPRKIMEHLNGFDEYYDCDDGGSIHDFFGRVMIAGYDTCVNSKLFCNMIDHRSWHPPNKDEDHLWHVMRQEKFRNKPPNKIKWEEQIQAIKEGKEPLRAKNCFDMIKQLKPLKIALISTPFFTVPPKGYGGLEQVVYDLAEALDELGHEVTLFAPEGSKATRHGHLITTGPSVSTVNIDWFQAEKNAYGMYKNMINDKDFDLIHSHTWFGFEYLLKINNPRLKVIHSHHGGYNWESAPPFPKPNIVAISNHMKLYTEQYFKQIGYNIRSEFIYNGIDLDKYPYKFNKTDHLLFVGRLSTFKQPHLAVELARKTRHKLDIVGGTFVDSEDYMKQLDKMVENDSDIKIYKDVSNEFKIEKMQNAKALIFPSNMGEPFGLCALEAMSCGTPVIATRDGAISEVVIHNHTGFICDNMSDMMKAVNNIDKISPENCRKRAEEFSRLKMAENYVKLYQRILNGDEW